MKRIFISVFSWCENDADLTKVKEPGGNPNIPRSGLIVSTMLLFHLERLEITRLPYRQPDMVHIKDFSVERLYTGSLNF